MSHQPTQPTTTTNQQQEVLDVLFTIYLVGRKMKQVAKKHHPEHIHDLMLEIGILRMIADQPKSVSELAEALSTGLPATSERVKALVKAGLVLQNSGNDARQSLCSITEKGVQRLLTTQNKMAHNCAAFSSDFSHQEMTTVKKFMTHILKTLL